MTARFAIYFAPDDDSPLGVFGATVLRRQARCPKEWINTSPPVVFHDIDVWQSTIQKPAHYGFHATIKAPFELATGTSVVDLEAALELFCASQSTILLTGLAPRRTHRYDALAFDQQPDAVKILAGSCIEAFETFRAPLTSADVERRKSVGLNQQQLDYLSEYGYPYIFDEFNFHMTLSGDKPDNSAYLRWLKALYGGLVSDPPLLDRLCLFKQENRRTPFIRVSEYKFPCR